MPIEPGAQQRTVHVVEAADLATELGTGDVPVLSTSRLVGWCEQASLEAVRPGLDAGQTTVAMRVHLDHLKPASIGCAIQVFATLERIDGRRYVFVTTALDPRGDMLATGRIVRVVVDEASFIASACGEPTAG